MNEFGQVYIDSSVIVRRTLQQPGALQHFPFTSAIASELLEVEVTRTMNNRYIARAFSEERWADIRLALRRNMAGIRLVPLDHVVLKRAMSAFRTAVGTLDAIHLATALLWTDYVQQPLTLLTHDRQLAIAAVDCGLDVYPKPFRPV